MIIDIPAATTTLNSINEWANPIFNEFWPYMKIPLGIITAAMIIIFLVNNIMDFLDRFFGWSSDYDRVITEADKQIAISKKLLNK